MNLLRLGSVFVIHSSDEVFGGGGHGDTVGSIVLQHLHLEPLNPQRNQTFHFQGQTIAAK